MAKGEENAKICWYCQKIAQCYPCKRPQNNCPYFAPMGKEITQNQVAIWLNTTRSDLCILIRKFGTDYIIEQLNERGYTVRYQIINKYIRFYDLNTGA